MAWAAAGQCTFDIVAILRLICVKATWCYDYLLTLDQEVQCFWQVRWSLNRALFLGYRYPGLVNTALVLLTTLTFLWQNVVVSTSTCVHCDVPSAMLNTLSEVAYFELWQAHTLTERADAGSCYISRWQ